MDAHIPNPDFPRLWGAIRQRLDVELPNWTQLIDHFGQVAAVERREAGLRWSDDEVFEALLRAVLSNSTDWAKIEAVLPELRGIFSGFSLSRYAETTADDVNERLLPWFKARKAGSMTLKRSLIDLARTARILREWSVSHGSAEHYFLHVIASCRDDPKGAAVALSDPGTTVKLPGLGVPLAAEALRNMGFDVCKPDRHVCRALGSFGLVKFRTWPDRDGTKPPQASAGEMLNTMTAVEALARSTATRPTLIDNAIWLMCARMGLYLSNTDLAAFGTAMAQSPRPAGG
jgi:hypothetical protein